MGSVYKVCDGELVYYGSTIKPIHRRLAEHKCKNTSETRHFNN